MDLHLTMIVEYAVGSGRHGITMFARDDAGIDRELRISYFSEEQSWGKTKGIDPAPQNEGNISASRAHSPVIAPLSQLSHDVVSIR